MSEVEQVYHKLVDALPENVMTSDVVMALGAVLSAVIIQHSKDQGCAVRAATEVCQRIMQAATTVAAIEDKPKYLN